MYSGFSQKQLDSLATGIFDLEEKGKDVAKLTKQKILLKIHLLHFLLIHFFYFFKIKKKKIIIQIHKQLF